MPYAGAMMGDRTTEPTANPIHDPTPDPIIVRDLVIAIFGMNGRLVEAGNHIVREVGLTTAWWQVLGALGYSPVPLPVAQIARNMGLARQSVQRVVDLLEARGLVRLEPNPHHRRARLVVLTLAGRNALAAAEAAEAPLNRMVLARVGTERIAAAIDLMAELDEIATAYIDTQVERAEQEDAA